MKKEDKKIEKLRAKGIIVSRTLFKKDKPGEIVFSPGREQRSKYFKEAIERAKWV